jgi:hypothetical protein
MKIGYGLFTCISKSHILKFLDLHVWFILRKKKTINK